MSCKQKEESRATLFQLLLPTETGISFENKLTENEDFNIIEYLYFYNGGGVSAGDVNNDGLVDLYFSSNQGSDRLYLNKGNFQFEDITDKAGVGGIGNWKTGVTMADVNGDGYLDIYQCGVGNYKKFDSRNQLYINNGDLTFTERAHEYGLDFKGLSTQASFFDYDNDGDLDMYLLNHSVRSVRSYGRASTRTEKDSLAGDRLFRNEMQKGVTLFSDVTLQAGIYSSQIGFGLGVATADINVDGFTDIYVSNDFRENDYLYLNRGDGTFKEVIEDAVSHTSRFSMGNDVADFNNDAQPDIITLDMLPRDEKVLKASVGEDSYEIYKFKLGYGYYYQVSRNALQMNLGNGHFSDIALLSGVADTDWSWAPLLADFDNDGFKDLFITNGIVRRPNDLDYLNFISGDSAQTLPDEELFKRMPHGKVGNFIFRNTGNLTFENKSLDWGVDLPSYSNGATYCDLDNDGDLDLIVNNINQSAFVYRNTLNDSTHHFLQLRFKGRALNPFGIGTKTLAFAKGKTIYQELAPTRGYESSVDYKLTLGLGNTEQLDSMLIIWPDRKFQTFRNIKTNQIIEVDYRNAGKVFDLAGLSDRRQLFEKIKIENQPAFQHKENDFVAFNREALIPHMVSTEGPKISVGDVNNDDLDDYFIGGSKGQASALFIQLRKGGFKATNKELFKLDSLSEDVGASFFDADGDKDLDLVVISAGNEELKSASILPRLYLNDGAGNFRKVKNQLPVIYVNASCVKPSDFDGDGDLDLFIGGRIIPFNYGIDPASFLLLNDGKGYFTNVSEHKLVNGGRLGMVTDATWQDINKDGKLDLVVVGEWMPITVLLQNGNGNFINQTNDYGLEKTNGWWNTISAADFDEDGDIDFVAGNLGLNSRLKAGSSEPVALFVNDYDKNGSTEQILTYFNQGISYPFVSRDQLVKQLPGMRKKFLRYQHYDTAKLDDILSPDQQNESEKKLAYHFQSSYFENSQGKFVMRDLPTEAQIFPLYSICVTDVNSDGHLDLMAVGNMYVTQPDFGRYDAGYGLVMTGDGKGNFQAVKPSFSGFLVEGEGRDIQVIRTSKSHRIYLVSRNNMSVIGYQTIEK